MNVLKTSLRTLVAVVALLSCLVGNQGFAEKSAADIAAIGKAAVQGDAKAQYNLGVRYANGTGVPPRLWRSCEVVSLGG
jgi:TPR repeat protein